MTKSSAPKAAARKARNTHRKRASKVGTSKARNIHHTVPKVAAEKARGTHRRTATQFEELRYTQVPDSIRALAERNVAQTRALYERSQKALQSVLENWQNSFGAAGQGAVALNRKIFDIAERNISASFDLAKSLAGSKNLAEVMDLQASYWRKQFGNLGAQAEEVRSLSTKMTTAGVVEPTRRKKADKFAR
jgi:hypothetical protein